MRQVFERLDATRKAKIYQQEAAKLEFAVQLHARMLDAEMSRADLAAAIEHSPAYITKVLRGDNNPTIETMVELVHALGGRLHFKMADHDQRVRWRGVVDGGSNARAAGTEVRAWANRPQDGHKTRINAATICDDEKDNVLVA